MKLVAIVAIAALSLGVRPSTTAACSCIRSRVEGLPAGETAPINTHVFLFVPARGAHSTAFGLYQKTAGKQPVVDVTSRIVASGSVSVVELTPKRPLLPETEYVVRDATNAVVHEFATSKLTDVAAPQWQGIAKAAHVMDEVVCCMCQTGLPYTDFDTVAVSDDTTATRDLLAAVWLADARGVIDYAAPPYAILRHYSGFYIGHPSTCSLPNFTYPKGSSMKLGVRLLDSAGNESDPVDVRFAITKPFLRKHGP